MTILASLAKAYERLPNAPIPGYSMQKIGVLIALNRDGSIASVTDLRSGEGRKRTAPLLAVPQPVKRTSGIAPNTFWDKTAYVLGVTAGAGKRTAEEHEAFVTHHRRLIAGSDDPGLLALLRFLEGWTPAMFAGPHFSDDMKEENVAFALEDERLQRMYLHDRPAARALVVAGDLVDQDSEAVCLVTGRRAPVAQLHPSIKGVWGGQTAGGSIVSFNLDAFESYGHSQGANAPVSTRAAAAYTGALNHFLARDSGHRIQIGDASTVFWADASDAETAEIAEGVIGAIFAGAPVDEAGETKKVRLVLERIAVGRPFGDIAPTLTKDVRYYVLGLSPNAARISIRFWLEDSFGHLAENYRLFNADLRMDFRGSGARKPLPALRTMAIHTAPARRDRNGKISFDVDHVSPLLTGELVRASLTGARFPASVLPTLVTRLRTDRVVSRIRISLIKAAIVRSMRLDGRLPTKDNYLVRSDPDDPNPARRLGRLFALIERAQSAALGDEINSTVADKFLSSAAATPRQVFPGVLLKGEKHLRRLRNGHSDAGWIKDAQMARRVGAALNRDIGRLAGMFQDGYPARHSTEEQGLFLVGYYQERYGPSGDDDPDVDEAVDETSID